MWYEEAWLTIDVPIHSRRVWRPSVQGSVQATEVLSHQTHHIISFRHSSIVKRERERAFLKLVKDTVGLKVCSIIITILLELSGSIPFLLLLALYISFARDLLASTQIHL